MGDTGQFVSCFYVGLRVEVEIPTTGMGTFRDWAVINGLDENIVSLQLSRDILPVGVVVNAGQMLSIRSEIDFEIYSCRAVVINRDCEHNLLLRLTGEFSGNENRKFYRVSAYLPLKIHSLSEDTPLSLTIQWEKRQMQRQAARQIRGLRYERILQEKLKIHEQERMQALIDGVPHTPPPQINITFPSEYEEFWGPTVSSLVNLSEGGIKVITEQNFRPGELVALELYIPTADQIVDIVGRVVFCGPDILSNLRQFHTGIEFSLIGDGARSVISNYITSIQLKRIRQSKGLTDSSHQRSLQKQDDCSQHLAFEESRVFLRQASPLQQVAFSLVFIMITVQAGFYLFKHFTKQPQNQIQVLVKNALDPIAH